VAPLVTTFICLLLHPLRLPLDHHLVHHMRHAPDLQGYIMMHNDIRQIIPARHHDQSMIYQWYWTRVVTSLRIHPQPFSFVVGRGPSDVIVLPHEVVASVPWDLRSIQLVSTLCTAQTCICVIGYGSFITFCGFVVARVYVICVRYLRVNRPGVRVRVFTGYGCGYGL